MSCTSCNGGYNKGYGYAVNGNKAVTSNVFGYQLFQDLASANEGQFLGQLNCPYPEASNYVIIGDTVAATLYAARLVANNKLVCNGSSCSITILTEGDQNGLEDFVLPTTGPQYLANWKQTSDTIETKYRRTNTIHWTQNRNTTTGGTPQRPVSVNQAVWDHVINTQTTNVDNGIVFSKAYHTGKGPLGDFAFSYVVPRVGPWWTSKTISKNIQARFYTSTQVYNLNEVELKVYRHLRNAFCLESVCLNIIAPRKSIMLDKIAYTCPTQPLQRQTNAINAANVANGTTSSNSGTSQCRGPEAQGYQMTFVTPPPSYEGWCPIPNDPMPNPITKQIFQSVYNTLRNMGGGNLYRYNVNSLSFEPSSTTTGATGTYTVSFKSGTTPETIYNANVIWMTNHIDYLRLLGESTFANNIITFPPYGSPEREGFSASTGLTPFPTTFRTVISIPKNNCLRDPPLNLTNYSIEGKVGDGVTSYVNFTLGERNGDGTPAWVIQAYTTDIDTYPIQNDGAVASANNINLPTSATDASGPQTLLIVEALYNPVNNTAAQRYAYYVGSGADTEVGVHVEFGRPEAEAAVYQDYITIVANILIAYTGDYYGFETVDDVALFFFGGQKSGAESGTPGQVQYALPSGVGSLTTTTIPREMTISTVLQTGTWLYGNATNVKLCPWTRTGSCTSDGCQFIPT